MQKKSLLAVVCFIILGFAVCSVSYAGDKVGYINLQRLVNESKIGQDARKDFAKSREKKEKAILKMGSEINKLRDEINKKGDKMSPAKKQKKLETIQKKYKEYKRLVADSKEDIQREDRELVSVILKKADKVLKKVAKKYKYGIILKDPNAIGYLDPDVDITDLVIKELDKKR